MALTYLRCVKQAMPSKNGGCFVGKGEARGRRSNYKVDYSMQTIQTYKLLTFTHKHLPIKDLGQFVLPEDGLDERLHALRRSMGMDELLYLATCNRVLFFYTDGSEEQPQEARLRDFLKQCYPHLRPEQLDELPSRMGVWSGEAAILHLFEVASSIDSLVVGEREILRQLRTAYQQCLDWKLTGDNIRLAMRFVVEAAKKVYSRTRIGEKPVSVVSLAIQSMLALHIPRTARFLIVGAGQTNNLVAKFLIKNQFEHFTVANRTLSRAQELAATLKGQALALNELRGYKEGFDVLIACTGATEPVITPELYRSLCGADQGRKVVIDLSIPHNVAPEVAQNEQVTYIQIEDLQQLAQENLEFRQQEVGKAQALLAQELEGFAAAFKARCIERALSQVPEQIKALRQHAQQNVFKQQLEALDEPSRQLVDTILQYMEKRCIAIPLQVAKENLVQ